MDEFALSDIARSQDEIKTHIEKGITGAAAVDKAEKFAVTWGALKK